jgi:long-chain acyl-CoA synthetase
LHVAACPKTRYRLKSHPFAVDTPQGDEIRVAPWKPPTEEQEGEMEDRPWFASYAPGVPRSIDFEKITMSQALSRTAARLPEHVALNYMGRRIRFAELEALVNRFTRELQGLGVKPGDKVAVCLPNIPQVVIANYAVFRAGAVVVQVNPLYTERELAYQLDDSDARFVITLSLLVPRMLKVKPQTRLETIIGCHIHSYLPFPKKQLFPWVKREMVRRIEPAAGVLEWDRLTAAGAAAPLSDASAWDELGALLYTGGTTGLSKGVMLSHANISCNVQQFAAFFPDLNPGEEKMVGNFPIFHSAGFTAIQNFAIWMGFENILVPRPDAKINIEILKKYKPSFLPAVPTLFVGLLADPQFRTIDFTGLKGFFSGAAPLAAETIRALKELTGGTICEVYGLTETTPVVTATPWGGIVKPGTVGVPVPECDVRIVDPVDPGRELPLGEIGEVAIRGPQIMRGYYKKPEETAQVMSGEWFLSGDLGRLDEDGYLTIVDRKKDMIIAAGYNIYPVELDGVLMEHPKILEACTIGIPHPVRGETVKAFIVVQPGATLAEDEVISFCRERLAPYKVPKVIEFMDELPKSAVGKILRRALRDAELARVRAPGR